MKACSSVAIGVAILCGAAAGEARAQRVEEPRAAIDFVTLVSGPRCTERAVFENALRGKTLCSELEVARPPIVVKEEARVETPKTEAPRVETPRVEAPRVETPRVETPRVETLPVDRVVEHPEEVYEAVVTATPEPASLALVASGLVGLAMYHRRRVKRS